MQRSLKLAEMLSEGENNSEVIEVGEKQLAAANRLVQGIGKLDQSSKLLNETLIESNELTEDKLDKEDDKNKSKPSSTGRPTSGQRSTSQQGGSNAQSTGSASGRDSRRSGSISDDIAPITPSGSSSGGGASGGSKKAPSASGGKDGASAGKKSNSGGRDGGVDGSGGGGGGGAKPQATGRPTGRGGTMSEEDTKAMIIEHEGIRYEPYKDSVGLWTVGVGHLICLLYTSDAADE